ncbi:hypothetical protein H4S07_000307 [Coemansia furcata]|uniref:Uncharacterized protein n=1 Tax=Coemansia furcata TaxID=417177 RepID=A0ACC1LRT6_9FUNG|nr:hypothetical protein H4S07_000307 [Coemansia furcata]
MSNHSIGSATSKVEYIDVGILGGIIECSENLPGMVRDEPDVNSIDQQETQMLNRYCRKVDMRILAYAIVLCILNQSDRGSIGVAKLAGLESDLHMVKNDFNIATTLFTVGYLSLEMFSNFILKRVGASRLLPTLGVIWGVVCALQGVIQTKSQLFLMRILLGMAECGFTAGILLILSFFYPKDKLTTRAGLFYLSSPLANVVSGPLASALSHIHHPYIKRWQWIFILEGAITVIVALLGYYILQDHPEKCRFLNDEEKRFIIKYKRRDGTLGGSQHLSFSDTRRALSDWQLWCMTSITFAVCEACGSVSVFAPELINDLGFTSAQAQAMSALPSACGAVAILLAGKTVRVCGSHWLACSLALFTALVGSIMMAVTLNVSVRMIGLCLLGTGGFSGLGTSPGWNITANSQTVANSAVAAALTVFMCSLSGFVMSNVFLNRDAPQFVIGHTTNIGLISMGIVACVVTRLSMGRRNRRFERETSEFDDGFRFVY